MKKNILAFTGIRSDYDLLSLLFSALKKDPEINFKLLVSGAHLSQNYGHTVDQIYKDGIPILAEIETLIDSDSRSSRAKSASLLLQNSLHSIQAFKPDLIIFAGDREDVLIASMIGAYLAIPTIHFYGGDHAPDGHVDNLIRHATSKLATVHFVAHKKHEERLIKMGEDQRRIFWVGSPALDKFFHEPRLTKLQLKQSLNCSWDNFCTLIYHPMFGDEQNSGVNFERILSILKSRKVPAFVSYPNVDAGSKQIIEVIDRFSSDENFKFYKNLDRNTFINLLRYSEFLIGNSSLGIYEAPLIPLAVINVGRRQRGRYEPDNVLFIDDDDTQINQAIDVLGTEGFKQKVRNTQSPFGEGNCVEKCLKLIHSIDFKSLLLKTQDPLARS